LKLKAVYFGSDEFSLKLLEKIYKNLDFIEIIKIITTPDKPRGRRYKLKPSPVKEFALKNDIPVLSPKSLIEEKEKVLEFIKDADLGLLLSYGKIIPSYLLEAFPLGILNIHPSLLPRYRGPSPIETALLNGDSFTGVSIILLTEGLDEGPIFDQKRILIEEKDDIFSLKEKLINLSFKMLKENKERFFQLYKFIKSVNLKAFEIYKLLENFRNFFIPQREFPFEISYTKKLSNNFRKIDFEKETAFEILRKIKVLKGRKPAFFLLNRKQIQILDAEVINKNSEFKPGQVAYVNKNYFLIQTKYGLLKPLRLKKEGKKEMDVKSFLAGNLLKLGDKLE